MEGIKFAYSLSVWYLEDGVPLQMGSIAILYI